MNEGKMRWVEAARAKRAQQLRESEIHQASRVRTKSSGRPERGDGKGLARPYLVNDQVSS